MAKPFRIGLIGFGNIGTGLVRHLQEYGDLIASRLDGGVELAMIADIDITRKRDVDPSPSTKLTTNWREMIADPTIDLVVELVGVGRDGKPTLACEIARAALSGGKHFVTANKGLIATYGGELHDIADANGKLLLYEASVGAGTPIIGPMQTSLVADRLVSVAGMVNGTCNYILKRVAEQPDLEMADAIKEAQQLGYAEPDPTFDVGGHDTAYKIVILASLAFGQEIRFEDVRRRGITELGGPELRYARENGYSLKLLAQARLHDDDSVEVSVGPAFVPESHVLSGVRDVHNAVLVEGDPNGDSLYYGEGAGQRSTASGLLADVVLAARIHRAGAANPYPLRIPRGRRKIRPASGISARHYIRISGNSPEDLEKAEKIGVPGRIIDRSAVYLVATTDLMSLGELDNSLGKLMEAGFSSASISHVRFAFE